MNETYVCKLFVTSADFICNKEDGLSRISTKADLVIFSLPHFVPPLYQCLAKSVVTSRSRLSSCTNIDVDDIFNCCNFSCWTWFQLRILKLWHETGNVVSETQSLSGCLRTLEYGDIHYLQYLIEDNPDYFLDELLYLLKTNQFISLHFTCLSRTPARVSHKKLQHIAKERDKARQIDFIRRMAQYNPGELGFIDEVSGDEQSIGRHYASGWSKRGH
jgi:hypothetical protein